MKMKALLLCALLLSLSASVAAKGPKLDGAYRYVSTTYSGSKQTDAVIKGMLVVHGKYMAFVRAGVNRKSWDQQDSAEERAKKIVAAYQGIAATCGEFTVEGDVITLQQLAQASPQSMGKAVKWEYKLEGNTLKIRPVGSDEVEFEFERLPD